MKEFEMIDSYFKHRSYQRKDVLLGIGDDCAITQVPQGQSLVTTTDTLVSGVHFFADAKGDEVAHKALAVNLSDLAAMGAEPAWISLSLAIPEVDEKWLSDFSEELRKLTDYYSVQLIGGDTVQGPLTVTITAHGFIPDGQQLTRNKAQPGDLLYVTGTLGDAGLGLDIELGKCVADKHDADYLRHRLLKPTPRLLAGTAFRRIANACIDISDGLVADLTHMLKASNCGATVQVEKLPLSRAMTNTVMGKQAFDYALTAGDDYELLFTVSAEQKGTLDTALANFNIDATCIGQLSGQKETLTLKHDDALYEVTKSGYEHF